MFVRWYDNGICARDGLKELVAARHDHRREWRSVFVEHRVACSSGDEVPLARESEG